MATEQTPQRSPLFPTDQLFWRLIYYARWFKQRNWLDYQARLYLMGFLHGAHHQHVEDLLADLEEKVGKET